jgi:iron complex outermembrane receptor protein
MRKFTNKLGLLLSAGCLIYPATAFAQQAPQAAADADQTGLEDIVVTAQRRAENMQNVPVSVSAFTASTLQAAGITSTRDIALVTPGFQIGQQLGAVILNIRGVGSQTGSPGDEASVSTYIDGFYVTDARGTIFDLNNIERVEVLKGPQGTLFGRNAVGGLVQIVTKTPTDSSIFEAKAGYGNYNSVTGDLYAATGIAHGIAADIAVAGRYQGHGYGKNLTTGRDTLRTNSVAVRSKWVFTLSDAIKQTVTGEYTKYQSSIGVARKPAPGAFGFGGYQTPATAGFHDITSNFDPLGRYRSWGVTSRTDVETDTFFNIVNMAQYRSGHGVESVDQDGTPTTVASVLQGSFAKYWTEELQLVSNDDSPFQWLAGVFYYHNNAGFNPLNVLGTSMLFSTVKTRSYAGFAQATYKLGDSTNLTGGIRYTHDRRELVGFRTNAAGVVNQTIPATVETPSKSSKVTWKAAIDHHFTDTVMVYASYSRGFKSGVYAASNLVNPLVKPEVLDAYEAGIKTELFDRKVRLNVAGFHYKWKNIQLSQTIPGGSFLFNAAAARLNGGEVEILANPVHNLTLSANVSVIDGKYTNFPNGPCFRGPRPTGGDIPEPLPPAGVATGVAGSCDLSGNKVLRTPPVTFTVGFNYTIPTEVGDFGVSASYYYNDGFFWESENRLKQEKYGLLSGQLSWAPNDTWEVRVWGKNLTNKNYNVYSNSNGTFGDAVSAAPPRTYGLTIGVKIK